jgi:hypothetical protein
VQSHNRQWPLAATAEHADGAIGQMALDRASLQPCIDMIEDFMESRRGQARKKAAP